MNGGIGGLLRVLRPTPVSLPTLALLLLLAPAIASSQPDAIDLCNPAIIESPHGSLSHPFTLTLPGMTVDFGADGVRIDLPIDRFAGHLLRWRVIGARPVAPEGIRPNLGTAYTIIGANGGAHRLDAFHDVRYDQLLPGVTAHFGVVDRALKYELEIARGVDPESIRIAYDGAGPLRIEDGELLIETSAGVLREERPIAWQTIDGARVDVDVRFVLDRDGVGFVLGAYDRRHAVTIDPALRFSTYLGGDNADAGRGVTVDAAGNTIGVGQSRSPDYPTTTGAYRRAPDTVNGSSDVVVSSFDPSGNHLLWSTRVVGSGLDDPIGGVRLSRTGDVVVGGITTSSDFPTTLGALQRNFGGGVDGFMLALDSTGSTLRWCTFIGGSRADSVAGFGFDVTGDIVVGGTSTSDNLPIPAGGFAQSRRGEEDAFIVRIEENGSAIVNGTWLGGLGADRLTGITVAPGGESFICGITESPSFPTTPDAIATTRAGVSDGFVTALRFDLTDITYSTLLGGDADDEPRGIARDVRGDLYLTGRTGSTDFPTTLGGATIGSWFVTKFDMPSGIIDYSRLISSDQLGSGVSIGVDLAFRAVVTGSTSSPTLASQLGLRTLGPRGGNDIALLRLTSDGGTIESGVVIGGSADDVPAAQTWLTPLNDLVVTGRTRSADFPRSRFPYDATRNSDPSSTADDALLLSWAFDVHPNLAAPPLRLLDTLGCENERIDTFFVHNDGEAPLTIYANLFRVADQRFTLIEPADLTNETLLPGDSLRYIVAYHSSDVVIDENDLLIYSSDSLGGRNPKVVKLTAGRIAPSVAALSTSLSFDRIPYCRDSTQILKLLNNGRGTITIDRPLFAVGTNFRIDPSVIFPIIIPALQQREVRVRFSPDVPGLFLDTLTVFPRECAGSLVTIPLSGRGEEVRLSGLIDTLRFDPLPSCAASIDTVLRLRNTGALPVTLRLNTLNGNFFSIIDPSLLPIVINPGAEREIPLRFTPGSSGNFVGRIVLGSAPCDTTFTIELRGTGPQSALLGTNVDTIDFGDVVACGIPSFDNDSTITIDNPATSTAQFGPLEFRGPFAFCGTFPPDQLPGGSAVDICVRMVPTVEGDLEGMVLIPYRIGECADTLRVVLRGRGVVPRLTAIEERIDLGRRSSCDGRLDTVLRVVNPTSSTIRIDSIRAGDAVSIAPDVEPRDVAAGDTLLLAVSIVPSAPGAFDETITIVTGPCRDTIVVHVVGEIEGVVTSTDRSAILFPTIMACAPPLVSHDTLKIVRSGDGGGESVTLDTLFLRNGGAFAVDGAAGLIGSVIDPDLGLHVPLTFSSDATGSFVDTLVLVIAPCGDTLLIPLAGATATPLLDIGSGLFGDVEVNGSATKSIIIGNDSPFPVLFSIDSLPTAPFTIDTTGLNLPRLLNPGDVIVLPTTFAPDSVGLEFTEVELRFDGGCDVVRRLLLQGTGVLESETIAFCISGLYLEPGRVGDTVTIPITASLSGPLASPVDLFFLVRYDPERFSFVDVENGNMVDIADGEGRVEIDALGVATLPDQLPTLRFRLLAGPFPTALVGLDSVAVVGGAGVTPRLCDTSAIVAIGDRCIIAGLSFGKYPNRLERIAPNPARERALIRFQQLEDARTTITIVDLNGRVVETPFEAFLPGGRYSIEMRIDHLASGLYMVRIDAGSWSESGMMMVEE